MAKCDKKIKNPMFIIIFIFFMIYTILLLIPLLWAFFASFKEQYDYLNDKVGFPISWEFSNYTRAFSALSAKGSNLFIMFWNSIWLSFGGTAIGVLVSAMSAYVVAKYKFLGRKSYYALALIIMMLPIVGALPSQYALYSAIGILDSPLLLVIYANGIGFNFLILYGFFSNISFSYVEAAFIDGANHFSTFFKIILPQAKGIIFALAVVAFINIWNDYNTPILFLESFPTLSSGIFIYQNDTLQKSIDVPMLFAGIFMSAIPVVILYICFQNQIMKISIGGGLKG